MIVKAIMESVDFTQKAMKPAMVIGTDEEAMRPHEKDFLCSVSTDFLGII
jgi:hypothetical protein